jgi:molybdate transport repressor ModE-like protein
MMKKSAKPDRRRPTRKDKLQGVGIRTRVWLTLGSGTRFCHGKAAILEAVDRLGSLRSAAQSMDMSYRHAWGMIRELDAAAGFPFLERTSTGTGPHLRLTDKGRRFIAEYRRFTAPLDRLVEARFRRSFRL